MKLAEALAERADLQNKLQELEQRLNAVAQVQVGDLPREDPVELINQMDLIYGRLQRLIQAIDYTNSVTMLQGRPLTAWLTERAILLNKRQAIVSLLRRSAVLPGRLSKSEIRMVSTIKASELQKKADTLAKSFRETDLLLQAKNWQAELLEVPWQHNINRPDVDASQNEEPVQDESQQLTAQTLCQV